MAVKIWEVAILFSSRNNSDEKELKIGSFTSREGRNPFFIKEQFWPDLPGGEKVYCWGREGRNPFFIKEQFWREDVVKANLKWTP